MGRFFRADKAAPEDTLIEDMLYVSHFNVEDRKGGMSAITSIVLVDNDGQQVMSHTLAKWLKVPGIELTPLFPGLQKFTEAQAFREKRLEAASKLAAGVRALVQSAGFSEQEARKLFVERNPELCKAAGVTG